MVNSVAWFEFGTDQPEKVKEFHGELFAWKDDLNTNTPGVAYPAGPLAEGRKAIEAGLADRLGRARQPPPRTEHPWRNTP